MFLGFYNILIKRFVVLPLYGRYLWLKNRLEKRTPLFKEQLLLIFTNKYLIHLIVAMIALGVATSNLLAYESREDYGQNALIYKITGGEDMETIEDTSTVTDNSNVFSYVDQTSQLESDLFTEIQRQEEESSDEQLNAGPTTGPGGIALLKPNVIGDEEGRLITKGIREYTVQSGDYIAKIAAKFSVSINTVLWANNLSLSSFIKEGQKLIIPPVSGVIHKVVKGDTLSKIAKKYEAEEDKISEFNGLDSDSALVVDETIIVPGGRIIYTPKPRVFDLASRSSRPAGSEEVIAASGGKMYWPNACRRLTQYYRGWLHTGVDIACAWGSEIRAAENGRVIRVQYGRTGYGYNIIIDHGDGRQTLYGHLSKIYVETGQSVAKGELVAAEGSTGRSTGPHLHFEVLVGGSRVNPLNYIR